MGTPKHVLHDEPVADLKSPLISFAGFIDCRGEMQTLTLDDEIEPC